MFSKTIISEKLILRPYESGDISYWQKWDADTTVQTFMPEIGNATLSPKEQIEYFKECRDESDGYYWTIVWKSNNLPIGTVSLTDINVHHRIGDLGVVIGEKEYWGKGVAVEAIKMILKFSPSLALRRIVAEFEEGNSAMEKVLINLNFQKESVPVASRIKNGRTINTVRYFTLV